MVRNRRNKNESDNDSSIRLPLKTGQVTGLSNDPSSAPQHLHLNDEIHEKSHDASNRAKGSGNEWGFFIHLDEKGRLFPGKLKEGTPHEWISLDEYLKARKLDETIHGLMHIHLEGRTVFSPSNIGFFLAANDAISVCMDIQ